MFAVITVLGAGRLVRALTDGGMDSVTARRTPAITISAGITMICVVLFILLCRANGDKEHVNAFLAS